MDDKKLLKLIRYILIIMVVATFLGIIINELLTPHQEDSLKDFSNKVQVESAFGRIELNNNPQLFDFFSNQNELTYTDEYLRFSISRPNLEWNFNTDLSQVNELNKNQLAKDSFLGGVFVEQNNDRSFFVGVLDTATLSEFELTEYVQTQIDFMTENYNAEVPIKKFASDNTWAIFGIRIPSGDNIVYGEQILEMHEGKLFMIQYTGLPPDLIEMSKREEMRKIIDSFTIE